MSGTPATVGRTECGSAVCVQWFDHEPVVLQRIHRPVPAIGRLQRDVGSRTGLADLAQQPIPVVVDADLTDDLTVRTHPTDHTAPAMQIDPDELGRCITLTHGGLPSRGDS